MYQNSFSITSIFGKDLCLWWKDLVEIIILSLHNGKVELTDRLVKFSRLTKFQNLNTVLEKLIQDLQGGVISITIVIVIFISISFYLQQHSSYLRTAVPTNAKVFLPGL